MLTRILKVLLAITVALTVGVVTLWATMALWYRGPDPAWLRYLLCAGFAGLGTASLVLRFRSGRNRVLVPYGIALALLVGWWSTLTAPATRDWAPDVARQVTGQIEGDILTLQNMRDFDWREDGHEARWISGRFDLSELNSLDMFLSYWSVPSIAHFVLSFGFSDGQQLAWSVEVRRAEDGVYSPIADLFKANPIVSIAATERDVIGLRTNIRKEDVHLFRLRTDIAGARRLLEQYVEDANRLASTPRWYNSITTNCTTVVLKMLDAVGEAPPLDWRILVNGYLPEFGYERGYLDTDYTVDELRELGRISAKGQAFGLEPGYSAAIRAGVPAP